MLKVYGILFCVVMKEAYGAQTILEPVSKPPDLANQEGCYDPILKTVLGYSVAHDGADCSRHLCEKNGHIVIATCSAVGVTEGKVLVKGNLSLPYPDCCDYAAPKPTP